MFVFIIGLMFLYLGASEFIKAKKSKGEVFVFPRRHMPHTSKKDEESAGDAKGPVRADKQDKEDVTIQRQTAIFHWQDVCYDIKIKKEERRILDHVDGWVKPGTLTALMVSTLASQASESRLIYGSRSGSIWCR
jgi:ATP-binding cassette subfamily G (WHITE) protein 2 (PDR)